MRLDQENNNTLDHVIKGDPKEAVSLPKNKDKLSYNDVYQR
jgi:hypothetical protein